LIIYQFSNSPTYPFNNSYLCDIRGNAMVGTLAIGNLKGGVGKSTLAVNLACALADTRRGVVLIDADAQGTAAYWVGLGRLPIRCEAVPLESQRGAERWIQRVTTLRNTVDLVVIDLPPHIGAATEAALIVADLLLVPVTASGADLLATGVVFTLSAFSGSKPNRFA
jgi:chromosome partitioning protein